MKSESIYVFMVCPVPKCLSLCAVAIECGGVCCERRGPICPAPLYVCVQLCHVARRPVECRTVLLLPSPRAGGASRMGTRRVQRPDRDQRSVLWSQYLCACEILRSEALFYLPLDILLALSSKQTTQLCQH